MIQGSREARRRAEDEKAQTSSRLWSSTLKNPRIVRVSRTFGGKDRHSKVRTVRGLRDRRIRLSVPTAIQLYALQDKLGLNQPSKVVDWLIAAAQHAIDELPPLEMSMIILQASDDHQLAAAAAAAAAPQFPQVHATTANVVPQNYMFNYAAQGGCSSINSGGDGLEAVLARSGKEKEAVKEASSCYPYYYHLERRLSGCSPRDHQNYPMPMFAPSSSMAAAREQESKQQYKYAGQMAAAGSAPEDDTSNPLRGTWNLHAAAFPNLMGLQQKSMKNLPRDHCESYIPRTSL